MTSTLYNCVRTIDAGDNVKFRITKFVDGEVESSYLTDRHTCDCPAGVRPTCRHRQMLSDFLNHDLVNQPWFWDFDRKMVVDFEGRVLPPTPAKDEFLEGIMDKADRNDEGKDIFDSVQDVLDTGEAVGEPTLHGHDSESEFAASLDPTPRLGGLRKL